jgi:hypothetical protein
VDWLVGCPVPVVCFALEKSDDGTERWTDFIVPEPLPLLFATSNVLLLSFVSVYPAWIANTLWRLVHGETRGRPTRPDKGDYAKRSVPNVS